MNELAVAIAIVLLPGLIASVICDKIVVHSVRWDGFKYSIYSFLFGICSYLLLQMLIYACLATSKIDIAPFTIDKPILGVWSIIGNQKSQISLLEVTLSTALSPLVAIIAAGIINFKILNKLAQKLKVSSKYGDENLFSFFLNSKEVSWVYVREKGAGLTYCGHVVSYAESDKIQELVLSNVKVFDYETSDELYETSLIYLSKSVGAFTIEVPMNTPPEGEGNDNQETD